MQTGNRRDQEINRQRIGGTDANRAGQAIVQALDLAFQFQRRMLHFLHGLECRFADSRQRITFGGAQEQGRTQ
ncbi:hypothetical protein D3C75_1189490 [compost metagenome]